MWLRGKVAGLWLRSITGVTVPVPVVVAQADRVVHVSPSVRRVVNSGAVCTATVSGLGVVLFLALPGIPVPRLGRRLGIIRSRMTSRASRSVFHPTRLETRTKESNMCASLPVLNRPGRQNESKSYDPRSPRKGLGAQYGPVYSVYRLAESERIRWYPKDGELCLGKTKSEETLMEVCSDSDVQIDRQTWV
jgi:hypothetical protein